MYKEEFLSIAERYYTEFSALTEAPNFYDYEKSFEIGLYSRIIKPYLIQIF
jgi:hypothetical protein